MRVLNPSNSNADASASIVTRFVRCMTVPNPIHASVDPFSSLLDEEEVHRCIRYDDKHSSKHCQSNHVSPEGQIVESKCTQDTCSGYLNVKAVSTIDQSQFRDLIDKQCFVSIVEEG